MGRDIVINPNRDFTGTTTQPEIRFSGLTGSSINLKIEDNGSLNFEGDTGGLFSIVDTKDGILHSVSDVSGLPIFSVFSDNRVEMGKWDNLAQTIIGNQTFIGPTASTESLLFISGGSMTVIGNISGGTEGGKIFSGGTDLYNIFSTAGTDGNGIYDGSGIIPTTTVATLTDTLAFSGGSVSIQGAGNTSSTDTLLLQDSDGTTTMVVEDGGDVGIGTASPTTKLQVDSTDTNTILTVSNTNVPKVTLAAHSLYGEIDLYDGVANKDIAMVATFPGWYYPPLVFGNRGALAGSPSSQIKIKNKSASTSLLYLESFDGLNKTIFTNSGHLGIGTTGPSTKLHVSGTTTLQGAGNTSSTDTLLLKDSDGTTTMVVEDGGDVGIGTAAPTAKLDIVGSTGASINYLRVGRGTTDAFKIWSNGGAYPELSLYDPSGVLSTRIGTVAGGTSVIGTKLSVGTTTTPTHSLFVQSTQGVLTKHFSVNNGTGNIFEIRNATSGYPELTLTDTTVVRTLISSRSDSYITWNGNVGNLGIGTTTPTAKLHVNGSTNLDGSLVLSGLTTTPAAGYVLQSTDANGNADWVNVNGLISGGTDGNGIYDGSGIIPTSTVASLTDTFKFSGGSVTIQGAGNGTTTDTLLLKDSDGTTTMVVEDGGDVGIGTAAPTAKLHMVKTGGNASSSVLKIHAENRTGGAPYDFLEFRAATSTTNNLIQYQDSAGDWGVGADLEDLTGAASHNLQFIAPGTLKINNRNSGNAIEVLNNATLSNIFTVSRLGDIFAGYSAANSYFKWAYAQGVEIRQQINNGNLLRMYDTGGVIKFIVKEDGITGIGTDSPTAKLHVNGSTNLDGSLVLSGLTTTPAAGYVLQSTDANGNADWVNVNGLISGATGTAKYVETTGFTASVPLTITHGLGTEDVTVNLWENSPKIQTDGVVEVVDSNNIKVTMATTATFKVVIIG